MIDKEVLEKFYSTFVVDKFIIGHFKKGIFRVTAQKKFHNSKWNLSFEMLSLNS